MSRPLSALAFLSACAAPSADSAAPAPPGEVLTAARLEAATRALTDLGPRPSGHPAEAQARDVVEALLADAGLTPTRHAFAWEPWLRGSATVTVDGAALPAQALSPSPTTDGLEATLVAADSGDLAGHLVLARSADGGRAGQFSDALLGGAAGLVRVTDDRDHDGALLVEVGHTLTGSRLPCVAVDAETGDRLEAALGQPVTLDIAAETAPGWQSHNVLATLPGDDAAHPVYVTAHYDSWDTAESAIDNALGVATLALLAERAARARVRERSIVFLATAGEEQGLTGAFRWSAEFPAEAGVASAVLNLDIPWAAEGAYLVSATDPALRAVGMAAAEAEGLAPVDAGEPSPASDHLPFQQRGVPAAWLTRWPDRHYHTHADTADQLDYAEAAAAARVNWAVLAHAAGLTD